MQSDCKTGSVGHFWIANDSHQAEIEKGWLLVCTLLFKECIIEGHNNRENGGLHSGGKASVKVKCVRLCVKVAERFPKISQGLFRFAGKPLRPLGHAESPRPERKDVETH